MDNLANKGKSKVDYEHVYSVRSDSYLVLSSSQRLPLGIPIKPAIIEKQKNRKPAEDNEKREKAGASAM